MLAGRLSVWDGGLFVFSDFPVLFLQSRCGLDMIRKKGGELVKQLYLIGGPMGVGKTTVCRVLNRMLDRSVFLDGDWCWNADPFVVTEETKAMVLDNICHLLNNFLHCSAYQNVVFCWVMQEQAILDSIVQRLDLVDCQVYPVSLLCRPDELERRLRRDIVSGCRDEDVIGRSLSRLALYECLDSQKLDVSELTPEETARQLIQLCQKSFLRKRKK